MTLRPPTAPAVLALLVLLAVVVAARPGVVAGLVVAALLLPAAPLVLPRLDVTPRGLVVDGVLRRHVVPWSAVDRVRQAWFVTLDLHDGRAVTVLAVPVVASMVEFRTWTVGDDDMFLRDSTRRRAHPGATTSLAVERIEACRPAGTNAALAGPAAPAAPTATVRTEWRVPVLVAAVLTVVGCLVLLVGVVATPW